MDGEAWRKAAQTDYEIQRCTPSSHDCSNPYEADVTNPDGSVSIQLSYNAPGQFNDGLVYSTALIDAQGRGVQETIITWERGDYDLPCIQRVETFSELAGQRTVTEYEYGLMHNQVTECARMTGMVLLYWDREHESTSPNSGYMQKTHIFNLPKESRSLKEHRQCLHRSSSTPTMQNLYPIHRVLSLTQLGQSIVAT